MTIPAIIKAPIIAMIYVNILRTAVLLSKFKTKKHINIELYTDELDLTSSKSIAIYTEVKQVVLNKYII